MALVGTRRAGGAREFAMSVLSEAGIEVGGARPWDLQVHDERLWERVLRDRELGLGESYQDGWWDAEALDELVARILTHDLRSAVRPGPATLSLLARATVGNRQSRRRAGPNASHHYDIGNDLYERMLDRQMIYSCAYWRDAGDLDAAQEAKLELICRKLALEPGMRVLDIGCGWGGFAHHAATRHGVRVTGITPAATQAELAAQRCAGLPVDIRRVDYREVDGTFDRIVSVGMMEHVGSKNLQAFFDRCDRLLTADGMMLHHTISGNRSKRSTDPWIDRYIFPVGVLPSLAQISRAAERRWAVEDVHNFGPDYDRTLMAWHANVEAAWPDLPRYDERFRRTWRYYLLTSAAAFRVRDLQLFQIVFRRTKRRSATYLAPR